MVNVREDEIVYRSRKTSLQLTLVLGGLAIGLLFAEIFLRLIGFQFDFYPTKVQIGWPDPIAIMEMYKPDKDLLWVTKDYTGQDPVSAAGKHPTLVFMGDSCTQFGEYDKFFADLVQDKYPTSALEYRNLGLGGWTSFQGVQQFRRDVIPMQPRVVTIYYGWNDHWCTFGLEDKEIWRSNLKHSALVTTLIHKSRTVQLINKVVFAKSFQGKVAAQRVSLPDFQTNLMEIVRLARENGITPVLLTAPSSHQPGQEPAYLTARWLNDLSQLIPLHESYVQVVRQVAQENDVDLVDLYQQFRELPPDEFQACFQGDGIHLTEEGDHKLAHYLYDNFVQTGLIDTLIAP